MFSVMKPGTIVYPHRGPYRGSLRVHLGLECPSMEEGCYIKIDDINFFQLCIDTIGYDKALAGGLYPFLPSELFKIALAVAIIPSITKLIR